MSQKTFAVAVAPLLFLLFLLPSPGLSQESETCLSCHNAMKGRMKAQSGGMVDLNVDAEKFKASVHAMLDYPQKIRKWHRRAGWKNLFCSWGNMAKTIRYFGPPEWR